jgi:hypothetical protein
MQTIPMKAGQVLLFDAALIHSSPPNYSDKLRCAVNFYIHNSESPFTHYYADEKTPHEQVALYHVNPDFYYTENFEDKPGPNYPFLGHQEICIPQISEKNLVRLLDGLTHKKSKWSLLFSSLFNSK